ncbi:2'-5' RNA ligase family protein [Microbacterium esteraromaticum]|uniref:2'-5' RNA ligase family protein n=1 Tax=Microbacterium esteraromaticum TaxID=57043 RepID=UPI001A9005DF|nr:2'-5' RNA ligase family protein [Microbacterium esteraromaticum]MBN8425696.1 2'-5' RNA ligase family protein [Microbacterium esteraromaticum]
MSRTALIVKGAASHKLVELRNRYALDAQLGVPPHLTILFPFVPEAQLDDECLRLLDEALGRVSSFSYSLVTTGWFGDHVLWLAPQDPTPFIRLTDAVCAAFPSYPPYAGAHDGVVPHLTVGDSADHPQLRRAEREAARMLPLSGAVAAVTLIGEGADGTWRELMEIPLRNEGVGAS